MIALVISIIVMLILAGVSISAIVGEDGLLTKAQQASFANKLATYNEEFEMNAVEAITDEGVDNRDKITLMNEYVKQYVPSLEDNDIGQFAIINGQLYYVGDEDLEREVCKSQGYNTLPEGMTAEEFASSVESSAVEDVLKNMIGDAFYEEKEDGTSGKVGVALANKVAGTFGSTQPWKIITEIENGETVATYGAGWYFVESGSTIEGIGTLKNSYIIDYTNRKAVKFDATKHTILYNGSNLAVTDGLVYNADPTNMGDGSESSWGGAILHGFSETEYNIDGSVKSGWDKTSFITDGIDDYVEYISESDFSNGITIDFYGNTTSNTQNASGSYLGKIHFFSKGINFNNAACFGYWNLETKGNLWWAYSGHRHWFVDNELFDNKDIYLNLICNSDYPKGQPYINLVKQSTIRSDGSNTWQNTLTYLNNTENGFIFGKGTDATGDNYSKLKIYSIRIYNRILSEEEMLANYNATVSYHNILVNNGNASTGGNTGGEDIDTIE